MNFDKLKEKYITLYNECRNFIVDPNSAWQKVVDEQYTWKDTQLRLLYPSLALIGVMGLLRVFLENFYISGYDVLTNSLLALAWPVILLIFLILGALSLRFVFRFKYLFNKWIDFERMVVFLSYAEIPLFISAAIFAFLPFMFGVLIFFNFYALYIIMLGFNVYFGDIIGEERKYNVPLTAITFLIIYALTYLAWLALEKF